ncbi:uncharacterized protein LOC144574179 isoform X2 [Carex rostrata]
MWVKQRRRRDLAIRSLVSYHSKKSARIRCLFVSNNFCVLLRWKISRVLLLPAYNITLAASCSPVPQLLVLLVAPPPVVRLKKPDPPKRKTTRGGVSDENASQMMVFSSMGNEKGKPTRANGGAPLLVPLKKHDPLKRKTTRGGVSNENATQMMVFSSLENEKGKPTRANGGASPLVPLKKHDPPERKTTRGGVSDENATQMMVFSSLGNEKGKPTRANGGVPPLVSLKKPDPSKRKTIMLVPLKKPDLPERTTTRGGASDENAAQMMIFSSLGNEKGKPKDAVSDTMGQQKGRAKRPVLTNLKCNIGSEMKVKMTDLSAAMKKGREKRPALHVDTHNSAGTTLVVPNKRRTTLREVPNVLSDGVLTGAPPLVRLKKPDLPKRKTTRRGVSDENATQMMVFSSLGNEKRKPTRANGGVPPLVPLKKSDIPERKTTRGGASDENAAQMMIFSSLGNEKGKPKDAVSDTMGQQKGRAKGPVLTNVKCNIGPEMKAKMTDLCAATKKGRGKRPASDVDTHIGAGTTLVVPNKKRATLREVPNILSDGMLTGARAFVMNPDTINGDTTSSGIVNIDCEKSNILMCSIYASDIYSNFRANELIGRPSSDFLERLQIDVTQNKRAVLMDWLVEVCQEYSLVPDTLHLTVNLVDRFLSMNKIERQRLQLLGVTCMLIASKYEETRAPHVRDLCLLTCNSYNENEVLQMERQVLSVVGYNLSVPTIKTFLRRFLRAALASSKAQPELMHLTNYLAELALVEYSFLEFLPSMIAAAAVFLGQWNLDQSTYPWAAI